MFPQIAMPAYSLTLMQAFQKIKLTHNVLRAENDPDPALI
jgi:hypothetical protein